jgi:hypothetical protein
MQLQERRLRVLPFAGSANNHEQPSCLLSLLGKVSCLMKVSHKVIVRLKKKPLVNQAWNSTTVPSRAGVILAVSYCWIKVITTGQVSYRMYLVALHQKLHRHPKDHDELSDAAPFRKPDPSSLCA